MQSGTAHSSAKSFSTSACLSKKGGKAAREEKKADSRGRNDAAAAAAATEDPYDFSGLESDIASTLERLRNDLSKLRAGGRFNPEVVENLRVQPDKQSNQTVKLNDVAQVILKGRTVQILVGEKDVGGRGQEGLYRAPALTTSHSMLRLFLPPSSLLPYRSHHNRILLARTNFS